MRESDGERQHQPAEDQRSRHHAAEHFRPDDELLLRTLAQEASEHRRHTEGKHQHQHQMALHHLRPIAMSNASMTTSKFSRPATMRKVLPYSYVTAITLPAPYPITRARIYGSPMPMFASAASATSGCDNSTGKILPSRKSPSTNIAGSTTRKISPLRRPSHRCPRPGTSRAAVHRRT